jgi:acyl-[acyl-carrier-protein]-phospholipid O-acyltransferase/long-chain-fatty-acid--[acyl-carrier-protein] ligase
MLLVKGPNLMAGYLNQPERTTGRSSRMVGTRRATVGMMDEDGFVFITDRLSRFSKIAGEMVPHLRIEEAINEMFGESCSAVTAVPDETRGERIVAFFTRTDITGGRPLGTTVPDGAAAALVAEARTSDASAGNPDVGHRES